MFVNGLASDSNQRGQALVETIIALPLVLLTLFGIILFSRLGVISERSQRAVRYGAEVVPPPTYLPQMYEALWIALSQNGGQLTSTTTGGCPSQIRSQVQLAVTNDETQPVHLAAAQAYWTPDQAAVAQCTISTVQVPFSSYNEVLTLGIAESLNVQVTSGINAPSYLTSLFPSMLSPSATDFALVPVSPTIVLSCTPRITDPVAEVLWPSYTAYRQQYATVSTFYGQPAKSSDYHADVVC